jgi:hypothetical protein
VTRAEFRELSSTVSGIQADSRVTLATLTQLVNHITKEKPAHVRADNRTPGTAHEVYENKRGKAASKNGTRQPKVGVGVDDRMDVDEEADEEADEEEDEPPLYRHKYQNPLLTQRQVKPFPSKLVQALLTAGFTGRRACVL